MSRVAKWKVEKTKVKVVFRLQFHATHIPQPGWDKLFVSFIPADSGKATAKTTKANVRNGNCRWSDPIYETTRLLQDSKTKKYDEKLYKLVVTMGSSRSSVLGEANINLAEYADASQPSSLALPLHGCDLGAVLHVTVQLLTSKTGFREFEQQRELREKGFQVITDPSVHEEPAEKVSAAAGMVNDQIDKMNARVGFKRDSLELPSLNEEGELNEDYTDSVVGIDGSSHTSEIIYAEKLDISTANEVDSVKSTFSGESGGFSLSQSPHPQKGDQCDPRLLAQGSSDWVHGWSSDYSLDNDLATAYEENSRLRGSLEVAEASILELKLELSSLQGHADELGGETQKLAEQLSAEITSGEEMARAVSILKSECSKLKDDFEQQKKNEVGNHKKNSSFPSPHVQVLPAVMKYDLLDCASFDSQLERNANGNNLNCLLHDLQTKWVQGVLVMEEKVRAIQNKTSLGYNERDLGFLHPDLKALEYVLQDLKEGTSQVTSLLNVEPVEVTDVRKLGPMSVQSEQFTPKEGLEGSDADLYPLEVMVHSSGRPRPDQFPPVLDLVEHNLGTSDAMGAKICELLSDLEESKAGCIGLTKKMNQMECYYEALIQELEESQKQVIDELQSLRNEHSTCLFTISTLKNQMEKMQQDMNEQFVSFSEDRCDLESLNKDLEQRAITSETALKRLRWNYSIAVDQIQKDLELLSFQVLTMFETNQNLARQAFTEASQLCFEEYIEGCSEEVHSCLYNDDLETGLRREQYKARMEGIAADIPRKTEQELLSKLNGPLSHPKEGFPVNCTIFKSKLNPHESGVNAEPEKHLLDENEITGPCQLQQELLFKEEGEVFEMYMLNLHLNIFSEVLQETLHEANDKIKLMKEKMDELAKQLGHSNELKELLMLKLQTALCDFEVLKESEAKCIAKCDNLKSENDIMETKLFIISEENLLLTEKVTECEGVLTECASFRSKYEACTAEKSALENALKQETVERSHLNLLLTEKATECEGVLTECASFRRKYEVCTAEKSDLENALKRETLEGSHLNLLLTEKATECEGVLTKCASYKSKYEACTEEKIDLEDALKQETVKKSDLENALKQETVEKSHLRSEINSLIEELKVLKAEAGKNSTEKDDLDKTVTFLQDKLEHMRSSMVYYSEQINERLTTSNSPWQELDNNNLTSTILHLEELQRKAYENIVQLSQEKKDMEEQRDIAKGSLEKLQLELQEVAYKLKISSEAEEICAEKNRVLSSKVTELEFELQHVTCENKDLAQEVLTSESYNKELERTKRTVIDCMQENKALMMSFQAGNGESVQMQNDISSLKESLRCTDEELQSERGFRGELEASVRDLTSQLNEKHKQITYLTSQLNVKQEQILSFDDKKVELLNLKQQVSDLELENSKVSHLLLHSEESQRKADEDASLLHLQITDMETHLAAMHEYLLVSDIEVIFIKNQFHSRIQDLLDQLKFVDGHNVELHLKHLDVVTRLDGCMAREAQYVEENARLMTALQSLRSELETVISEKKELEDYVDKRTAMCAEIETYKTREMIVEAGNSQEMGRLEVEIEGLRSVVMASEEEIDNLRSSRLELEVTAIVLKSKLDEQCAQISLLQEFGDELMKLRNQHNELSYRFSEQILKTEEFKNLSIHLKELKDKADAKCLQAREKTDTESPSVAMQESLRIAFIREQCETKLQELRSQLYGSKKLGEEMLLKLQNSLDETESRKRSEASHVKRNEELSMKILELEAELRTVLAERREKVWDYDRVKPELECCMISLECCKEEKLELEASLQECNEERTRIAVELDLIKGHLESYGSPTNIQEKRNHEPGFLNSMSAVPLLEDDSSRVSVFQQETTIAEDNMLSSSREVEHSSPVSIGERKRSSLPTKKLQSLQDGLVFKSALEVSRKVPVEQEDVLPNDMKHIAFVNEHFKEQSLKSSIDRLHKELERLKDENMGTLLPLDEHHFDPAYQGLQRELLQLHMANERLGSIFPLFNQFSGSGNALERVLALEIELAETLQAKKKSNLHFQSSFLKQHNDEEAVFQSFRDINELIKDMLELKRSYGAVEIELKEMHERYSELSLQFAEVEGERQKLVMKLKNSRSPKKS
ncbi:sporulation-specific protein [Tasmannia lanceolata]|uniref:sporulation-specific protein n=1 Tax=Tasmannia lanceolata TaxID=3420 RepID=UPI004063CEB0